MADYTEEAYSDFEIVCKDGKLQYHRVFLAANKVFKAMLDFGGIESKERQLIVTYTKATMNVILGYLDPRISVYENIPEKINLVELINAAALYEIHHIVDRCWSVILGDPQYEYLEVCATYFEECYADYLTLLANSGKLENKATYQVYVEAFKVADFMTVARQFHADKYEFNTAEINIPEDLDAVDLEVFLLLFDTTEVRAAILKCLMDRLKDTAPIPSNISNKNGKIFPANKLVYFRDLFKYSEEFRKRVITEEMMHEMDNTPMIKNKTGAQKIMAMSTWTWNYHKNHPETNIYKEVELQWYGIVNYAAISTKRAEEISAIN